MLLRRVILIVRQLLLSFILASPAISYCKENIPPPKDQGHSALSFHGSIIYAPCSITSTSLDQNIELGSISNASINSEASLKKIPFKIQLQNCSSETMSTITVLFDGKSDDTSPGNLSISGKTRDASLFFEDSNGRKIEIGVPTIPKQITTGDNTMIFWVGLTSNLSQHELPKPRRFTAVTNFTIKYN